MPTSYSRRLPVALAALGLIASIAAPVSGNSDSLLASELTTVFVQLS